jgi:hypothetical protein
MGWGRKFQLITVEDLPPEWDLPEPPPLVVNPCQEIPLGLGNISARRVVFPMFEMVSNPTIPLTQIRERRFDLIERSQTLGRAAIQASEDAQIFRVLDEMMREQPTPQVEHD